MMDIIVFILLVVLCIPLFKQFRNEQKQNNLIYELKIKALKKYLGEDDEKKN